MTGNRRKGRGNLHFSGFLLYTRLCVLLQISEQVAQIHLFVYY